MSDTLKSIDGGLSAPAKRGRPRKDAATSGVAIGNKDDENGAGRASEGVEGTPAESAPERGRFPIVDPLDIPLDAGAGGDSADSGTRRGRRKYTKRGQKEEAVSNLSALLKIERLLVTGCFFLGNIANTPELFISEDEAKEIGEALKELSKHYPIGMSEKTIAWVNFTFAAGGVFGPKVVAIYKRPRAPKPSRVINIRPEAATSAARPTEAAVNSVPNIPMAAPEVAKVPSQMWAQPGDIEDND